MKKDIYLAIIHTFGYDTNLIGDTLKRKGSKIQNTLYTYLGDWWLKTNGKWLRITICNNVNVPIAKSELTELIMKFVPQVQNTLRIEIKADTVVHFIDIKEAVDYTFPYLMK